MALNAQAPFFSSTNFRPAHQQPGTSSSSDKSFRTEKIIGKLPQPKIFDNTVNDLSQQKVALDLSDTKQKASSDLMNNVWNWSTGQASKNAQQLMTDSAIASASSSIPKASTKIASSLLVGGAGAVVGAIPDLVNGVLDYKAKQRATDVSEQLGNRALDLDTSRFEADWGAAHAAGLLSPAQFGALGSTGYYKSTGSSSIPTKHAYSSPSSSFA